MALYSPVPRLAEQLVRTRNKYRVDTFRPSTVQQFASPLYIV